MVWAHVTMWQSQKGFPCLIHFATEVRQQYLLGLQGLRIHVTCQQHTVTPDMDMKDSVDKLYYTLYTTHPMPVVVLVSMIGQVVTCVGCRSRQERHWELQWRGRAPDTWHQWWPLSSPDTTTLNWLNCPVTAKITTDQPAHSSLQL